MAHFGYVLGELAPCIRDIYAGMSAAHHLLLGQGKAVQAFRPAARRGEIGNYHALTDILPASDSEADVAAAERTNAYVNTLYLDAIVRGEYPCRHGRVLRRGLAGGRATATWSDLGAARLPRLQLLLALDRRRCRDQRRRGRAARRRHRRGRSARRGRGAPARCPRVAPTRRSPGSAGRSSPRACAASSAGCATATTTRRSSSARWAPSFDDTVSADGCVHDEDRLAYIRDHIVAAHQAIDDGVDLRGLFLWAFMDTYEFNLGYSDQVRPDPGRLRDAGAHDQGLRLLVPRRDGQQCSRDRGGGELRWLESDTSGEPSQARSTTTAGSTRPCGRSSNSSCARPA